MSVFKNRQEHENYVNSILGSQKDTMPDKLLHVFLWEKIKLIFKYDDSVVDKYEDNADNIIVLEDENGIMIIGYLQIDRKWDPKSSHDSNTIINALVEFDSDIRRLANAKGITSFRLIFVTTYKLSTFQSGIFSKLPKDVSYFYLAEIDESNKLHFDLNRDESIIELINSDITVDKVFDYMRGKKYDKDLRGEWDCDVCGGNNLTGCQYHDPTECPKFT